MFPQLYMRMITGRTPKDLTGYGRLPLAAIIVFFTMAYCGMWGKLAFPGLEGAQSDNILPMVMASYLPAALMAILGAAIFAALMSTMDSQLWAASLLLLRDFILPQEKGKQISEKAAITWSRMITLCLVVIAYIMAQFNITGIINIVNFAFAGFAVLIFPMLAALYWPRCTKQAVAASILCSQFVLLGLQYGFLPKSLTFGFLPGFPAIIVSLVVLVVVTYLTPPPENEGTRKFFETFALAGKKAGKAWFEDGPGVARKRAKPDILPLQVRLYDGLFLKKSGC